MNIPPIYVVSGATGKSGEQIVRTALAQFPQKDVSIVVIPQVCEEEQLEKIADQAAETQGTIVYTLVNTNQRETLKRIAHRKRVVAIDLLGQLLARLAAVMGHEPFGQPGLYRELNQEYFDRVAAIEFAVMHDDGRNLDGLYLADLVIVGVSRVGKTPLSMYLSVQGWRVANVPLVKGIRPPQELFHVDRRRVVGLTIEAGQLIAHRRVRQQRLGVRGESAYTDPREIYEELESANQIIKKAGFPMINITDKPVEETAEEVISLLNRRLATA
jgi:regulator of PEP synthase PpsR (kinase-PPPase family)